MRFLEKERAHWIPTSSQPLLRNMTSRANVNANKTRKSEFGHSLPSLALKQQDRERTNLDRSGHQLLESDTDSDSMSLCQ